MVLAGKEANLRNITSVLRRVALAITFGPLGGNV